MLLMYAPGSETGPGPQLVTWGKSTILSVDAYGFKFEYTSNSAKHILFDWTVPPDSPGCAAGRRSRMDSTHHGPRQYGS